MSSDNAETTAQVHAIVSQHFAAGQRVQIQFDSDGAAGSGGAIRTVFPSGRCLVDLDCGGFRNLPPSWLRLDESQDCRRTDKSSTGESL